MSSGWFEDLIAYKRSVFLFTALDLGLFDLLQQPLYLSEIAQKLNLHEQKVRIFLLGLERTGYVMRKEDKYILRHEHFPYNTKSSEEIQAIFRLEKMIFENLVTPKKVLRSLIPKHIKQEREPVLQDEVFISNYMDTVYNKNLNLRLARLLKLLLQDINNPILMESGRSNGKLSSYLTRFLPNVQSYWWQNQGDYTSQESVPIPLKVDESIPTIIHNLFELNTLTVDAVTIQNTIHYWTTDDLNRVLNKLVPVMSRKGILIIHDLFLDHLEESGLQERCNALLLDWLTHGGIEHLTVQETLLKLQEGGWVIQKVQNWRELGTMIQCTQKGG